MRHWIRLLVLFIAVVPVWADEVLRWNRVATDVAAAAQTDPLTESRAFAILHVAVHDAVNTVETRYDTYGRPKSAELCAPAAVAAAAAAHEVLIELFPSGRAAFDAALAESMRSVADRGAAERGIAVGRKAARTVLEARRSDGADRIILYPHGSRRGEYRPTPPDFTPAFMVHWGRVKPFVLRSGSQFRGAPPPAVDSERARIDTEVVRAVGAKEGATRNADQSEISRFWYEHSTQGWNRIARVVAEARGLDLHENARLFALVNLAMADGFIAGFDAKYHYVYWRPATAMRDRGDEEWLSDLVTPPVPDYPSTHTVLGSAAATVLARFFETDYVPFRMTSGEPYAGITRAFWSFSDAARENGASRVLAGIHFPTAVTEGYRQGESVGTFVFDHALRPIETRQAALGRVTGAAR